MERENAIERQARVQAAESKEGEPAIRRILWFPDDSEVRLVLVEDDVARALSEEVEPFYFGPAPDEELPAPSGIALIRSDECGKLRLPDGWAPWADAVEIEVS